MLGPESGILSRHTRGAGTRMRLRLFAPRYWLTWAGIGLLRLLAMLPFPALLATGRVLGAVLRHLPIRFVSDRAPQHRAVLSGA